MFSKSYQVGTCHAGVRSISNAEPTASSIYITRYRISSVRDSTFGRLARFFCGLSSLRDRVQVNCCISWAGWQKKKSIWLTSDATLIFSDHLTLRCNHFSKNHFKGLSNSSWSLFSNHAVATLSFQSDIVLTKKKLTTFTASLYCSFEPGMLHPLQFI